MNEQLRLMAVHAHPDDESSKGAATMARYVSEGVDVLVATLTGGERGSILNPAMERPDVIDNLPEIRRQEMTVHGSCWASVRRGWGSSTPGCPRATRCLPYRRAASPCSRSTSRPNRSYGLYGSTARTSW